MRRTLVIGDIHGCLSELKGLISRLELTVHDTVVLCGDLVDKGPDPMGVLRYAQEMGFVLVRGNHDDKHLRYHRGVAAGRDSSKLPNLRGEDPLPLTESDLLYLSSAPLYWQDTDQTIIVVHAGIPPWIKTLDRGGGKDLMYCRYITPEGRLTSGLERPGPEDKFHADLYDGRFGFMLFGHQAYPGTDPVRFPHATGIDLGCVYGGSLCCAVVSHTETGPKIDYVVEPAQKAYCEVRAYED